MKNDTNNNECTNDKIEIVTESACNCSEAPIINYIPDEYFYNSCECSTCNCESVSDGKFCSCGYMTNPTGYSAAESFPCKCSNLNFFN